MLQKRESKNINSKVFKIAPPLRSCLKKTCLYELGIKDKLRKMFSLDDERFQVFGACSLLLLAKMTCMSLMTSRQRIKTGKFANKEDSYFGDKSTPANLKVILFKQTSEFFFESKVAGHSN